MHSIVEAMGGDKSDKGKRDRQLNVRLTADDITLMTRAAARGLAGRDPIHFLDYAELGPPEGRRDPEEPTQARLKSGDITGT